MSHILTTLVTPQGHQDIDGCADLPTALRRGYELWMEQPAGPQALLFTRDDGFVVATMLRDPASDPAVAVTAYADGSVQRHRCRYLYEQRCPVW